MEKGEMRVEANISVSKDQNELGTKVEVKNLNSFKSVEKAIKFELERMLELSENGKSSEIVQETRGWDEEKQKTFSQRKKESSQDYRYFPEPDLPKMKLHEIFDLKEMRGKLPELPEAKRARYRKDFGIKDEDIESYINDRELGKWFEEVAKKLSNKDSIKILSNYITSDYLGLKRTNLDLRCPSAESFAELVNLVSESKISSRVAKDILAMIVLKDESPLKIAIDMNLLQISDEKILKPIIQEIINANPKVVADYKSGQQSSIMSLVGQIMKETNGSANPEKTKQILQDMLK